LASPLISITLFIFSTYSAVKDTYLFGIAAEAIIAKEEGFAFPFDY
jgi:hypothetical protein